MKKISLLLIIALLSFAGHAQEKKKMQKSHESHKMEQEADHEARAMIYADKMATRLSLNLEQKEEIKKAQMKRLEDQQKLMAENMTASDSEIKDGKKKIQDDFKEEMKEILTDAQFSKWKPMHDREINMHEKKVYKKTKNKEEKETDY